MKQAARGVDRDAEHAHPQGKKGQKSGEKDSRKKGEMVKKCGKGKKGAQGEKSKQHTPHIKRPGRGRPHKAAAQIHSDGEKSEDLKAVEDRQFSKIMDNLPDDAKPTPGVKTGKYNYTKAKDGCISRIQIQCYAYWMAVMWGGPGQLCLHGVTQSVLNVVCMQCVTQAQTARVLRHEGRCHTAQ